MHVLSDRCDNPHSGKLLLPLDSIPKGLVPGMCLALVQASALEQAGGLPPPGTHSFPSKQQKDVQLLPALQ